jgi:hypothetical protein
MATIMTGGARRSAAPAYQQAVPVRAQALNLDPELLRKQIAQQAEEQAVGLPNQQGSLAESFARGTSTLSGQGGNVSFGGSASPGMAKNVQAVGQGVSALGTLAGNPTMSQFGGMLGLGGALGQATTPGQALGVMAGPALSMMGVPTGAIGLGASALQGNVPGMINSALSLANPGLAALNALGGLLGIGTIGGAVKAGMQNVQLGANVNPDASLLGQYQAGAAINDADDPIGALISAKSLAATSAPSTTGAGYGVTGGSLGNLTYGGGGGQGGRGFGGYGGGIGQSGGNASGMGSSQA